MNSDYNIKNDDRKEYIMKKKPIAVAILTLCIALFTGCQEEKKDVVNNSEENLLVLKEEKSIEGYGLMDGSEIPIRITIGIESILRGEEAYNELYVQNADIDNPSENEEYIIVIFNISYDEGEIEELFMMENRASLEEARLYFSLSNSKSNAYDVTSYLANNIYNVSILKGQSVQGAVAFLQEKGNVEPLYFVGFGEVIEFNVNQF